MARIRSLGGPISARKEPNFLSNEVLVVLSRGRCCRHLAPCSGGREGPILGDKLQLTVDVSDSDSAGGERSATAGVLVATCI